MGYKDYKKKSYNKYNDSKNKENDKEESVESMEDIDEESVIAEESKTEIKEMPKIARINRPLVRIRKSPAIKDDNELTVVTENAEFKVNQANTTDDFVCIYINGSDGYVMKELVDIFDNPAYVSHDVKKF